MRKAVAVAGGLLAFLGGGAIWQMREFDMFEMVYCMNGKTNIPAFVCRQWMHAFRGHAEDVQYVREHGLGSILELQDAGEREELLKRFLSRGVDVNAKTQGYTGLHYAVMVKNADVARLLLKYGADTSIRDDAHRATPLQYATELKEKTRTRDYDDVMKALH